MQSFKYKKVDFSDKEMMNQIYELRYQVYAHECGFINPDDYPDGRESDIYDAQSVHFAAFNEFDEIIGTIRVILPGEHPLPIQTHCPDVIIDKNPRDALPQVSFGEISRLVISKQLRRRRNDGRYYEPEVEDRVVKNLEGKKFLRRSKPMAFGLYRELYIESKRLGVTHWYTLMEKSLWLLLRIHGFTFENIGKEVDVYGPVNPYIGKVDKIEQEIARKFPQFFEYFSEGVEREIT